MNFDELFDFVLKRWDEIGFREDEAQELAQILRRVKVKYPYIIRLSSGVILDSEYAKFGFMEDKEERGL